MISATFKVQTIGEILKTARKKRGLSLKQISEVIKIRQEYLRALENGDYSVFASEVYLKGFLKNYAKFLGIDQKRALALYRREHAEKQKSNIKAPDIKTHEKINPTITPERLIISIVLILAVAIVYYLINQVSYILKKPILKITSPITIEAEKEGSFDTTDDTITIKGEVSAGATLKLNGNDVVTNNLQQFEINNISLTSGSNEFMITAESQFGKKSWIKLKVNKLDETTDNDTTIEEDTEQISIMNITISVSPADANVLVITDGQTQINQVLRNGQTKSFTANKNVIIQSPRPTNVHITINGQSFEIQTSQRHEWELINGEIRQIR